VFVCLFVCLFTVVVVIFFSNSLTISECLLDRRCLIEKMTVVPGKILPQGTLLVLSV